MRPKHSGYHSSLRTYQKKEQPSSVSVTKTLLGKSLQEQANTVVRNREAEVDVSLFERDAGQDAMTILDQTPE